MAQFFQVHPDNPQPRLLKQTAALLARGGIAAVPTDSSYALVCQLDDKAAADALRRIRGIDDKHHLTLLCRDLSELSAYARVDNKQFRMLKAATPGPYTFILEATKEVPRRLAHPKKRTVGVRIPDSPVVRALLRELGQPLLSSTLLLPGQDDPMTDGWSIKEELDHQVDAVLDAGDCGTVPTTVVDWSEGEPVVVREGAGDVARFT